MGDISSLYPAPPSPQSALGGIGGINPLQLVDTIQAMQLRNIQIQREQGQLPAAVQQPAAVLQGTNIDNATHLMQQRDAARQILDGFVAPLSDKPDISAADVENARISAYQNYHDVMPLELLHGYFDGILKDPTGRGRAPADIATQLKLIRNRAAGPGATIQPTEGESDPTTGQPAKVTVGRGALAGARPVGLAPGAPASIDAMNKDLIRTGSFASDIYPLQQAMEKINALGPGGTAPGSKTRQEYESFAYGLAPQLSKYIGVDASKIKNYAELEKYLTQAVQARAGNFGVHTDAGLATATSGSPNVHVVDLATKDLIRAGIGIARMERAQVMQAAQAGPTGYLAAKADFAGQQDPRAFQIDMMSPDEIKSLSKTLKGPALDRFNSSLRAAIRSGVLTHPDSKIQARIMGGGQQ
jgi:hypothetical protein